MVSASENRLAAISSLLALTSSESSTSGWASNALAVRIRKFTSWSPTMNGCDTSRRTRSRSISTRIWLDARTASTNSSPPKRAVIRSGQRILSIRSAIALSTASPVGSPYSSLIERKWTMSTIEDAEPAALRDQRFGMAHEPVTVEQAGAAVVLGEEVHPVAGVGEGRGDLGTDHVAVHDRVVEQVVHRELAGDLLVGPVVVGHQEAGVEGDRAVRRHRADGVEHVLAIFGMQVVDDRPATDEFGVVAEQSGDRAVDRADRARARRPARPSRACSPSPPAARRCRPGRSRADAGAVTSRATTRIGAVAMRRRHRLGMGAAQISRYTQVPSPGAHPDGDQVAEPLGPDGLQRRQREADDRRDGRGRCTDVPIMSAAIPAEHLARHRCWRRAGSRRPRARRPDRPAHRRMACPDRPSRTRSTRRWPRCAIGFSCRELEAGSEFDEHRRGTDEVRVADTPDRQG